MTIRIEGIEDNHIDRSNMHLRAHRRDVVTAINIVLDMDQRIVSTIHIAGLVKKILVLSKHIATNDIDLAICIAPSRACILKSSICIAGRRRNILNESIAIHIVFSKVWESCRNTWFAEITHC